MAIRILSIQDEVFQDFKDPAMLIGFPNCCFNCRGCQNQHLRESPTIEIGCKEIVDRYMKNPITKAICLGGLNPLDSFLEVISLIKEFRQRINDPIVIYTGYKAEEMNDVKLWLAQFPNIYIKWGNYIEGHQPHFDEVLGIMLASNNQWGEKIS